MDSHKSKMKFLLFSFVILSVTTVTESWHSFARVTTRGAVSLGENNRSPGRKPSGTELRDLVDGNLQWYRTSTSSTPSPTVTQDAINRKLRNAAERFMKFQSGYFSPMMPNDNNVNLNSMNNNYNYAYDDNSYNYNNDGYSDYNDYNDPSSILADDFVFRGPVIGPLNKWDYIDVLDYFRVYEAFPDINPNCYGFSVDVIDPLKVRFFVKATGTYQYPLGGFLGKVGNMLQKPDGREYVGSTEAWSITFNDLDRMQVKYISAGYVVDRFEDQDRLSTTDGKGLVMGVLNTIGLDFLPTQPESTSLKMMQWATGHFSKKGGSDALFPKAFTASRDLPQWWGDERKGAN
mmetsp:Transcript_5116/g.14873  ORF Transcript_5116/g.14873 Transcript_5116/m.14873 type:complete len:347 (-) Transcript_5116:191-1231(-)